MKWVLIILLLLLTGCARHEIIVVYQNSTNYIATDTLGVRTQTSGCTLNNWPYPDYNCTPGAIIPTATKEVVCVSGYTKTVRNVPDALNAQVYAEYNLVKVPYANEVDHLISLELGGSNDIANLWPEKYNDTYGARVKDRVENTLHAKVCSGEITLSEAQYQIAHNWTAWI